MAVTAAAVVLNVQDAGRAAAFWGQALAYEQETPEFLRPPDGTPGVRLHLDERDRTHLDVWVDRSSSDLESEVARLIGLGATRCVDVPRER